MGKDNGVLARNGHTEALLDLPRMAGLAPGGALIEILNEDGIMALNQRTLKILNLIREDGHAKVQELSRIFNVTDVTIRQDLEELEKQGFVLREHGGTFLKDAGPFAKAGKVFNQTRLEQVFRYPYRYLGCTLPVSRLWVSSLTDEAIRKGMRTYPYTRRTKSGQRSIPPL